MAIQTPYPYPYPKKMEEYEAELVEKDEKIAELEKELKEAQEKLGKVEEELNKFRQAELDRLIGEIKGFDSEFDEKKVLGSVECFDAKKALLESYLSMVKKTKQTKLSVSDADNLEARVKKIIDEMGINIETILKR
jgi:septal ring factor EnvC (AmiA/AmiB activator)